MRAVAVLLLGFMPAMAQAFDVNGVALGGREADVKKSFPSAYCKPLDWKSEAADRRCDDGRSSFGGVPARVTFYLKGNAIQAFDLRFASSDRDKVLVHLRSRWGAPASEITDSLSRRDRSDRKVHKTRWAKGQDQAVLTAPLDQRRATLSASRGNFDEEIYRVR